MIVETEQLGPVMVVTLNRPERLNALSPELLRELTRVWGEAADDSVRAVVVTGAGRGFCAGADLRRDPDQPVDTTPGGLRSTYNPHVLALAALDKPVIAAVNGAAAGAGLALACAADIIIASTKARFIPAFAKIGVVPDAGASFFIVRALGYNAAFDWLSSAQEMSADEARQRGLVSEVVEPEELVERAIARAQTLAAMPGRALGLTKRLLAQAQGNTLAEQLEAEHVLQALAVADPARQAARQAVAEGLGNRTSVGAPDAPSVEAVAPAH